MGTNSVRTIVIFSVVLLLVASAVGVSIYHRAAPAPATAARGVNPSTATACTDFVQNHAPGRDVKAMQSHARALADQERFNDALAGYREIAAVDPGFPGLNLDISRMLLKLNQAKLAKESINSQIAVSECLPHLDLESMDAYCKSELYPSTLACMHELNSVQQGAYIQAALVQMELGRALGPDSTADAEAMTPALSAPPSVEHPKPLKVTPPARPAHTVAATITPLNPAPKPTRVLVASRNSDTAPGLKPVKHPNASQLASGSGTDAALGAYSK